MGNEDKNYFKFLLKSRYLFHGFIKILDFILVAKGFKKLTYKVGSLVKDSYNRKDDFIKDNIRSKFVEDNREYTIKLPTQYIKLKSNNVNFLNKFEDDEDMFNLHRFGWLIMLSVDNNSKYLPEDAKKWILEWIDLYLEKKEDNKIWESYSVSERIVNWIYLDIIFSDIVNDERISQAIKEHVTYLVNHLEYRGYLTQNHILNNARALYFYGHSFSNQEMLNIAHKLFYRFTPFLVSDNGYVKEGSVHYHFLLTRTFIELAILSKKNDSKFYKYLEKYCENMISVSEFFLIQDEDGNFHIPLIGDVSPDYPVDWLIGIVDVAKKKLNFLTKYNYSTIYNSYNKLF